MLENVQNVPVADIEASEVALRGVQTETLDWQNLKDSIARYGVMNSIQIRPDKVVEGVQKYVLIDGLQRYTACKVLGRETIPATIVTDVSETDALMRQLVANVSGVPTRPVEQSKHILRMLMLNPILTKKDIASSLCQSLSWVDQRLSLTNLIAKAQALVENGSIPLFSAYALARLEEADQEKFLDDALTLDAQQFGAKVKEHSLKQKRAAARGEAATTEWQPTQHLRKPGDVKAQFEAIQKGQPAPIQEDANQAGVTLDPESVKFVLAWVLSVDPLAAAQQKKKHEEREKKKKELEEQKKAERAALKAKADQTVNLLKL